jgi:hypothetical protein
VGRKIYLKKIIAPMLFMVLTLALVACDSKQTVSQSTPTSKDEEQSKQQTEKEQNASLEIVDSGSTVWVDSINTVWVNSAAVYKNTGDVAVEIGETQMNFKAKDESIMGTSSMIYAIPSVVQPGETAIIGEGTVLDGETTIDNFLETTYNFNFEPTEADSNLMEISNVKGVQGEYDYSVTGMVKNPTDVQQEDVRIAAILYDGSNKIIGALTGSVDVGLAPNGEAGFELNYPSLPENIGTKVKNIEVKGYGYTW